MIGVGLGVVWVRFDERIPHRQDLVEATTTEQGVVELAPELKVVGRGVDLALERRDGIVAGGRWHLRGR